MTSRMETTGLVEFICSLMSIPSLSGNEAPATAFLAEEFAKRDWKYEKFPVIDGRENIMVSFGTPRVCFSTHVDVVAAPDSLFTPKVVDGKILGRGSCDAKGIVGCMVATAERLLHQGKKDFGLLFVVGEEYDGCGAAAAGKQLQGRGIQYIVNGEPTVGKLMVGHKGGLTIWVSFKGRSCHSGYPHLGDDANAKLIRFMGKMLEADLGNDEFLGKATVNLGKIEAGTGTNIVSPIAQVGIQIRTVSDNAKIVERVKEIAGPEAELRVVNNTRPVKLKTIPGMETDVAAYCTDIPHFDPLGAECLLYGPGTIFVAHTDNEYVEIRELEEAIEGYLKIFDALA